MILVWRNPEVSSTSRSSGREGRGAKPCRRDEGAQANIEDSPNALKEGGHSLCLALGGLEQRLHVSGATAQGLRQPTLARSTRQSTVCAQSPPQHITRLTVTVHCCALPTVSCISSGFYTELFPVARDMEVYPFVRQMSSHKGRLSPRRAPDVAAAMWCIRFSSSSL